VKFVNELKRSLHGQHQVTLNLTEEVVEHLAKVGYDDKLGARPLARKIDELIRVPLSKLILFQRLKSCTVTARLVDGAIDFDINSDSTVKINNDEFITIN
jgi:ATP-dependent Clp protease ATP-binding subunit ClpA